MTTLLLQALVLASMRGQTPSVSFTCRAEPLSRLVVDLGKATSLNLSVSTACAKDVLVIAATSVPLPDLMNEIAKVDAGQWKKTSDGYIFSADVIARRAEARHENARQASQIAALINKGLSDWAKAQQDTKKHDISSDPQAAALAAMSAMTPEKVAVLKLLKGIDPSSLVLPPDRRAVFSTHPNQMQLSLGGDADAIIGELIKSHNASVPKSGAPTEIPGVNMDDPSAAYLKNYMARMGKVIDGYSKADLVVGAMPFLGGVTATLALYDAKGNILLTANDPLDTGMLQAMLEKPASTASTSTKIELSPESQAFTKLVSRQGGGMMGGQHPVPAIFQPFLVDPEHHDPLALTPTDKLLALAQNRQKPMVAVVPDDALGLIGSLLGTADTLESFVQELEDGKNLVKNYENGWIEIKPASPESARQNRTDRAALGKLMRSARAKGLASLDDVAEFAQKAPSPMIAGLTQVYLSLFVPGSATQGMDGITNWNMYRIYGQISPDRRQALLTGGRVSLDTLSMSQQASLAEMVYGPMAQLQVGKAADSDSNIMTQMMALSMGGQDYKDEPTELLPSGVPGGGVFEMTAEQEPFVSPMSAGDDGSAIPQIVGADELAVLKYLSDQPAFAKMSNMMPKFDKMKLGSRVVYHLTFHLTDNIRLTGTLKDNKLGSDAETVSANNLPQNLQDLVSKKMAALKKSPLGMIGAMGAGGAATPPPSL